MNRWLGVSICWMLRRHKWRRPYATELHNPPMSFDERHDPK